jgi:hypothetical protein
MARSKQFDMTGSTCRTSICDSAGRSHHQAHGSGTQIGTVSVTRVHAGDGQPAGVVGGSAPHWPLGGSWGISRLRGRKKTRTNFWHILGRPSGLHLLTCGSVLHPQVSSR